MGPLQAPAVETSVLVTPGCWEGVARKDGSGLLFLVLFPMYLVVVSAGKRAGVIQPQS